jgi:AraC-like DNA-binding protein
MNGATPLGSGSGRRVGGILGPGHVPDDPDDLAGGAALAVVPETQDRWSGSCWFSYIAAQPVHAVATRWGYSRHSDSTRVFRAQYGLPPQEYRRSMPPQRSGTRR